MKRRQGKIGNAVCHVYLLILTSIAVFPLLWILISSIKGKGELTGNPTGFLPKTVTLDYFEHVIHDLGFITNIKNSIIISLITTVIAITIASMAAYGIVRFFPRVGAIMSRFLVTTYIFPPILLAIPYSIVMAKLGLTNTRVGLIIVYLSFSMERKNISCSTKQKKKMITEQVSITEQKWTVQSSMVIRIKSHHCGCRVL